LIGNGLVIESPDLRRNFAFTSSLFQWTETVPHVPKPTGDLARPITALPHAEDKGKDLSFEKPEWTKNSGLAQTGKGAALKDGKEIARPIGGIKPVEE
jgi:hypothetical protein